MNQVLLLITTEANKKIARKIAKLLLKKKNLSKKFQKLAEMRMETG